MFLYLLWNDIFLYNDTLYVLFYEHVKNNTWIVYQDRLCQSIKSEVWLNKINN